MSQGSEGSPVLFLDPAACDDTLADLRGESGRLPTFSDSEPGSPPPTLEAEEAHGERATQTSPVQRHDQSTSALPTVSTSDQSTQVISRPHQATSATQTLPSTPSVDQSTQVLLRPRHPLPGFDTVDLTADEVMDMAPATPPPTVSDSVGDEMETDEEGDLLASTGNSDRDSDGFQHV